MNLSWKVWAALAATILAAAFLWGGRYTVAGRGNLIFVVDRFTGAVRSCTVLWRKRHKPRGLSVRT